MAGRGGPERGDPELVAAARAGDRDAAEQLLRRHHDRIATLCRRIAGNPHDAADCTQEALVAVLRGLDRFDGRSSFSTWCYRVTTNACLDELRRRRRRPVPVDDADPVAPPPTAPGPDVADRVDVDRALAALPLEFRVPVVLRDLCGLDYAEIASLCDLAPGTVRSRIARGRRRLASLLGGPGSGEPVAGEPGGNQPADPDVEGGDDEPTLRRS